MARPGLRARGSARGAAVAAGAATAGECALEASRSLCVSRRARRACRRHIDAVRVRADQEPPARRARGARARAGRSGTARGCAAAIAPQARRVCRGAHVELATGMAEALHASPSLAPEHADELLVVAQFLRRPPPELEVLRFDELRRAAA